jgi:transcriptional regulator with XRE-family HTH domain
VSSTAAVTLSRTEYERLLATVEQAEDQAVIALAQAREAQLGKEAARKDHLPIELVDRLLAGEIPVRIWREHRAIAAEDLARAASLSPEVLSDIEDGLVPLSPEAATLIGTALDVPLEELGVASGPPLAAVPRPADAFVPALVMDEADEHHRYTIVQTEDGFELRWRERSPLGLYMAQKGTFPDEASARAGLEALKAFHLWWRAVLEGGSTSQLQEEAAAAQERLRSLMAAARKSGG